MEAKRAQVTTYLKIAVLTLSVLALVTAIAVGIKYVNDKKSEARIAELEQAVNDLRSSINIDSIRQYSIQKVIAIINQYNLEMPAHQKYEIADEIYQMSVKYSNLNVDLICATITHETAGTWDPEIVSPAGAMGLMQIMPTTGMFVAAYEGLNLPSAEDVLFNPIYNIRIGARYLSSLIDAYDIDGGLAAYNGGERRAALWLGSGKAHGILARETQEYVPAIRKLYEEFQAMTL